MRGHVLVTCHDMLQCAGKLSEEEDGYILD